MSVANINIYKKNHCIRSTEQQPPKGRGKKKRISYGQADRKHLPPPPLRSVFCEKFVSWFFTLHYDSMCSETDFTHEKVNFHAATGIVL